MTNGHDFQNRPPLGGRARPDYPQTRLVVVLAVLAVMTLGGLLLHLVGAAAAGTPIAMAPIDGTSTATQDLVEQASFGRGHVRLIGFAFALGIIAWQLIAGRKRFSRMSPDAVKSSLTMTVVLVGLLLLAGRLAIAGNDPGTSASWTTDLMFSTSGGLVDVLVIHLLLAAIMPWSVAETTLPCALLLVAWAATFLVPTGEFDIVNRVVAVVASPLVLVPGAALSGWRERRRDEAAERLSLAGQVESFGGELTRARIVHDAMFPDSFTGPISFEYEYQPIHEIGGDYVHVFTCGATGRVTVTLLDVAGHGLAAALTVNRLFGELERILAEDSSAGPGTIATLLNRYIFLTMSRHSLFATGACIRLDPATGELEWVNAGHPPMFVRHPNGAVDELGTTTMLLGVLEPSGFDPETRSQHLQPGAVILAYTDGAFEARNGSGERFGLNRLRETARFDPPPRSWPRFISGAVSKYHEGHADDDVLIAAVTLNRLQVRDTSDHAFPAEVTHAAASSPVGN